MLSYQQKLARVLDRMGGVYLVDDILTRIADGKMQGHVINNSWMITEVHAFPRARQLSVVALVGDLEDGEALHAKAVAYAEDNGIGLISAYGRRGWMPNAIAHGWKLKAKNYLYHKEL
jgi:hypothetical protein